MALSQVIPSPLRGEFYYLRASVFICEPDNFGLARRGLRITASSAFRPIL